MIKLSPAQDKAIKAFHVGGEFPKGTRAATIEGIRAAGLIEQWNGDGSWDLTDEGRKYLGVETTVEEITELLDTNPWDAEITVPAGWDTPRNRAFWKGLSQEEINADIQTAQTVANRGDRRSGNTLPFKHAKI